ncbi:UDP-N-acetylmuramyl pentapeptide phosphotransferase/UDP-N-acetylglucosamine-1-phosphate transferase [Dysgonomonas sp. PFB1-18]|uniref:MraY family glycosyltransferase n=1 Tax=unclassified Dysgonomonas TaxID=2630389 RepID=UPI002475577F|nr:MULTISPECIES: glycosyltransferase family 4 protein [unclassified Dysgonomonas]MDH6307764.1 UDP-N-acetylmuramyl pentapeptide phosphotransferase/UDP-N-acetylglucosamine-1-phosphate transferase [Dysgonomonas sp. PF1-14]MDH6337682.1 UDP-N-acetylmuramyl pentapeptide phosphotransferase/UDP-N-acetylglucosamine-1-phosphate transferase [Dysgonomonas sp. PF1-16]MDH6378906.1 UDP-N-acetylmuramyl pentapeptide phosphotransferase/UDP-N-acetylglucosamine-1-phosphate transferase [Dysgonomonas sp. PFB1-18]MDH
MLYIVVFLLLSTLILLYFKIADKYNIVDKPNERSSHTEITLRGGGVIIWFAALIYFLIHIKANFLFFTGITLISFISFYDDIKSLPSRVRALVQLFSVAIIFYDLAIYSIFPWWGVVLAFIISVGIINAYNFMDGINGITGLYSIVVFGSFLYVNNNVVAFTDSDFLIFPIIACAIFLFFNYRKKAKCFAGDIGSISIAFWIIYILVKLVITTNSIAWLLFLAVYGVDSICTILHRLYLKQNIFKPHRLHFYQILSNEYKIDHRIVALLYAVVQGIVSLVTIMLYSKDNSVNIVVALIILLPLLFIYTAKFILIRNGSVYNKR